MSMFDKIPEKFHIPAAIVAGCGVIATAIAYAFSPDEERAQIAGAVATVWAFVQTFLPALLKSGAEK